MQIRSLIENYKPTFVVIEEIAGSKNRISQKTLDGLHWIVLINNPEILDIVKYQDVTGLDGWRSHLGLKLTEQDKLNNKEAKKLNKDLAPSSRLPIYDTKDLAARHVNQNFGLSLDPQERDSDADIADSIAMGHAWLITKCPKLV